MRIMRIENEYCEKHEGLSIECYLVLSEAKNFDDYKIKLTFAELKELKDRLNRWDFMEGV